MNLNMGSMREYVDFLEESSRRIVQLCEELEVNLGEAIQYMDQPSGLYASKRLLQNIENIKKSVPMNDETVKKLVLTMRRVQDAQNVFGGRR